MKTTVEFTSDEIYTMLHEKLVKKDVGLQKIALDMDVTVNDCMSIEKVTVTFDYDLNELEEE